MWPTLFTVGPEGSKLPVHTWGVMVTLAFLAAAGWVQLRARREGVDGDKLVGFYLVAFAAGLAGARLLHFTMAEPERFFRDPLVYFKFWEGGFAFYGGVIVAALAGFAYAAWRGIDPWKLADLAAPALMLGLSIGRWGCFFAGCCHGLPVELPADATALLPASFSGGQVYVFPHPPFLLVENEHGVGLNGRPLLPTPLWSSLVAFALFLLLAWRLRHKRYDGQVFAWLLLTYPVTRSTIEAFRGDTIRGVDWFGFLSTSQLLSIPVWLVGLVLVAWRRGKGVAEVQQVDEDAELLDELSRD